jgi:hypothetical protein
MSRPWRLAVSAFLLSAGLSTLPASSNPLTDLLNPAPKEDAAPAPAPAPAREQCASQPGRSAAPGQHWFYRLDGHRKCWYQGPEEHASARRQLYRHAAKPRVVDPEESEAALHKKTVADARAQLLSAAPADVPQPAPSAPEVVDTAPPPASSAAISVPAAPIVAQPTITQITPRAMRRSVDVEMLLAADVPLAGDTVAASAAPANPPATAATDAEQGHWGQAGMVLIVLGLASLLAGLLLASRFRDPVSAIR